MSPLCGSVTPQQVPSLETSPVLTPDHQDTTGTAPVLCPAVPGVLNDESPAGLGTRTRGPRDSPRRPVLTPVTPRRALHRPLVRVRGAGERRGRALILVLPVSSRVDRVVLRGATIGAGDNRRVTSVGRRTMAIPWSSPSYSRYRGPVDRGQPPQGTMTANNHQVLFHPSKF